MRERSWSLVKWITSNIAYDALKGGAQWLFPLLVSYFGSNRIVEAIPRIVSAVDEFLSSSGISLTGYSLVFIIIFLAILGLFSLISAPFKLIWTLAIAKDDPKIVQDGEWNAIVNRSNLRIGIGMISLKNEPDKKTDRSTAFGVNAQVEYFDRKNKLLMIIDCAYWTRIGADDFFPAYGKAEPCQPIDFYSYQKWHIPVVYKVAGDETVFAYDPTSPLFSKELGKLPIALKITLDAENYSPPRPLNYMLIPQPGGLEGFWIRKR